MYCVGIFITKENIMELNRFKQLLESTMGNVKPLIVEDEIKENVKKLIDEMPQLEIANVLLYNEGGLKFKKHTEAANDPNSPLRLSRKRWKCSGSKSTKS